MARTKSISARNHRKTLKAAKGFKHARSRRIRTAKEAVMHAGKYAYIGRKLKKRDLRKLWIIRLNAAVREHGMSYSVFVKALKDKKIEINRKILSDIAVKDPKTFGEIVKKVQ